MPARGSALTSRRRARAGAALTLVAAAGIAAPAQASTLVGTDSPNWTGSFSSVSLGPGRTAFNITDPRPTSAIQSPVAGIVTRFRSEEFSGSGHWQLVIIRDGASAGTYRVVDATPVMHQNGVTRFSFAARLPIQVGDRLGLRNADSQFSYFLGGQSSAGMVTGVFNAQAPGSAAAAPDGANGADTAYPLNADVEADADSDGYGDETQDNCPGVASSDMTDTDADGQGDVCDADDDNDGLADTAETTAGTSRTNPDSDGDGVKDGAEVTAGTNPLAADTDSDGLGDAAEQAIGTNPLQADTDGDTVRDGADLCPTTAGEATNGCPVVTKTEVKTVDTTIVQTVGIVDAPPTVAFTSPDAGASVTAAVDLSLAATDDHAVTKVQVFDGTTAVCTLTAPPYTCRWQPTADTIGTRLLVAVAHDAAGGVGVARLPLRIARFTPAALRSSVSAGYMGRRTTVTARGQLALPEGVTERQGCYGDVLVRVRVGARTRSSRTVRLLEDCTFASEVRLRGVRPRARVRVDAVFMGNAYLTRVRATTRATRSRSTTAAARRAQFGVVLTRPGF